MTVRDFTLEDLHTDVETEKGLLTAIAADPDVYWRIVDLAPVEVWTEYAEAFERAAVAIEKGEKPEAVGGEPVADPVEAARRLANLFQKRQIAGLIQAVSDRLHNTDAPAVDLITELEGGISAVQQAIRELRAGQTIALPDLFGEVMKQVAARYEATRGGEEAAGLPTGIKGLDKLLGGLQKGIHLMAAEPGQGKTTFALQIARTVAAAGYPVLFLSFEESLDRLALKALCSAAGLPLARFTNGYGKPEELRPAMEEHGPRLANLHLVEGTGRLTIGQVKAKALQLMAKTGKNRCLILVDYLQVWANRIDPETLAETEADRRIFKDFRFVVGRLAGQLRELAMRLDSPMIVISSQNRTGQGSGSLASLKESGDLEYGADSVWFLRTPEDRVGEGAARAVDLHIAKNRYGDKGAVKLIFRPSHGAFAEVVR